MSILIVDADAEGPILTCQQGLSLWGGVDPKTGIVIDAHHDQHGACLAGKIVLMPTSRGSCSGSSILLDLALNGQAPAALVFREEDEILTLGAVVATQMFHSPIAVARLSPQDYARLAAQSSASLKAGRLMAGDLSISLGKETSTLSLEARDVEMLEGRKGPALQRAMETICAIAKSQGARELIDVSRGHIDGCIYASEAHFSFAEKMRELGAKMSIPTTTNAISVDRENWQNQGTPPIFGTKAERLADLYVEMGARPNFTCAPYLLDDAPKRAEVIGWSESNAVIFANTVLGARTAKHPDFMDLFVAMTGRAPNAGVYLEDNRRAGVVVDVQIKGELDDAFWPMLGWLAGQAAPDRIPLLTGLARLAPSRDALKAMCAAFGTTSGAPMLHVEGVTPESDLPARADAVHVTLQASDFKAAWQEFNAGPAEIDLIALGSPHFSLTEIRSFAAAMAPLTPRGDVPIIITLGRDTRAQAEAEGLVEALETKGVTFVSDVCWCSISEPVFPPEARNLMTNSGKYAHYAPGLSGRSVRFGSLANCAKAAETGLAPEACSWLAG